MNMLTLDYHRWPTAFIPYGCSENVKCFILMLFSSSQSDYLTYHSIQCTKLLKHETFNCKNRASLQEPSSFTLSLYSSDLSKYINTLCICCDKYRSLLACMSFSQMHRFAYWLLFMIHTFKFSALFKLTCKFYTLMWNSSCFQFSLLSVFCIFVRSHSDF